MRDRGQDDVMSQRDEHDLGVLSETERFELLAKQSFGHLAIGPTTSPSSSP
jgi:hypothetical protein